MQDLLKKSCLLILLFAVSTVTCAKAIIDADVLQELRTHTPFEHTANTSANTLSLLIFLHNVSSKQFFIEAIKKIQGAVIQDLSFMPAVVIQVPKDRRIINYIANMQAAAQISSYKATTPELDITAQILKLAPSDSYREVNNWWAHGYTGKKGIVGLLDTGIDPLHPALADKHVIVRQESGSAYSAYINGVKEPHATGVACIYLGNNETYRGLAYGASTILSGLAGEETADTSSIMLTMSTLDWMLNRAGPKPTIINYSMGNGRVDQNCPACPEWSSLAKVMDYVVNTQKILWVKSAGNVGDVTPTYRPPFASTLTSPGDNYNGLTIANMNTVITENGKRIKTPDRTKHHIKSTSSRGPTPFGRRKPDLAAPGHDTRTCAPDPQVYGFNYSSLMDYKDGYRLMGGTSSAAPHVGAAVLLLQDAGIQNPIAIKALLINSADTWIDADIDHTQILGSAWNRTYGWGYINMEKAFNQRNQITEDALFINRPLYEYRTILDIGDKVTLVHERRVGYTREGTEWKLSHLSLELIDLDTLRTVDIDNSPIDTVHQVSNCNRTPNTPYCGKDTKIMHALIRVRLLNETIDGNETEPFSIVIPRVSH